jgi:hypothetical protein
MRASSGPHLVVAVASHGWGHLAQVVPMAVALHDRLPGLRITVRSGLDASLVRQRFAERGLPRPEVSADDTEFGFVMHDALSVDDAASWARYRHLFQAREALAARERDALRALRADAVLADIGWVPIAAAASLGLPAWGASSLNWAEMLASRPAPPGDAAPILRWMRDAYARADALFALQPGMPFDGFANRVIVGPMARRGERRPQALRAALGLREGCRTMLLAFGGLPLPLATEGWRPPAGWHAVVMAAGATEGPGVSVGAPAGWTFIDLLSSCDLLVAKPGYGTFAEAAFAGRDTLVVPREDWAESSCLVEWLAGHVRMATLPLEALRAGALQGPMRVLDAQPARAAPQGDGAAQIADAIAARLGGVSRGATPAAGGKTAG